MVAKRPHVRKDTQKRKSTIELEKGNLFKAHGFRNLVLPFN